MDFVVDELASGRRVKTLTVVDDCSKEAVQIAADTSMPALYVTRLLDQLGIARGLPKVIRTDNGPEFAGCTMHDWAAGNGVELRFIQFGKPSRCQKMNLRVEVQSAEREDLVDRNETRSRQPVWTSSGPRDFVFDSCANDQQRRMDRRETSTVNVSGAIAPQYANELAGVGIRRPRR